MSWKAKRVIKVVSLGSKGSKFSPVDPYQKNGKTILTELLLLKVYSFPINKLGKKKKEQKTGERYIRLLLQSALLQMAMQWYAAKKCLLALHGVFGAASHKAPLKWTIA